MPFAESEDAQAILDNTDHEHRTFAPSELRRHLSQLAVPAAQDQAGSDDGISKRASTMTAAMGLGTVDSEIREAIPPIVICGLLYFKKPVAVKDLRVLLKERLLDIPRFRSIVVEQDKEVFLKQVSRETVDMEYHVQEAKQDKPWSQSDLDAYLSNAYADPKEWDTSNPLWRFTVVPKLEDGRHLVVVMIDHTLVDGVAAVATLMAILDDKDESANSGASKIVPTKRVAGPNMCITRQIMAFMGGLKQGLLGPVLPSDPPNTLKEKDHRRPGKEKACAFGEQVSLVEMKEVKNKFQGATVNDVMLTTLTLALRRYFTEVGENTQKIRANFPISMRSPKEDVLHESMGNKFSAGIFSFPVHLTDPVEILWSIKQQIDMIKRSPAPMIQDKMLGFLVPLLIKTGKHKELWDAVMDSYGKVSAMLSNVPGPSEQVSLCKQPIDDIMFYAFAPLGIYFGIISYNDQVSVGVVTGKHIEPQPSRIAKHWAPAFKELKDAVAASGNLKPPADRSDLLGLGALGALALIAGIAIKLRRRR